MTRGHCPTWVPNVIQTPIYVENASIAHLSFEHALIAGRDVGGKAYFVTDPHPAVEFRELYDALTLLTEGRTSFSHLPPVLMLIFAYLVELYTLIPLPLPPIKPSADILNLQPPIFSITSLHLIIDDS